MYGTLSQYDQITGIKISIPNPPKTAYVRLPTSAEMLDYLKPTKKKDATQEERSLDLFQRIRLDQGEPFDAFEANSAIDAVTRSRGLTFERIGNTYNIEVETPFGNTEHTVNISTQKQITLFWRSAIKNYLNAVVLLYDQLIATTAGYIAENYASRRSGLP